MTDWVEVYADGVAAVAAMAEPLSVDQLATVVPATPDWTVRQVIAHLAGTASDIATGRMDGAPGAEWTARHVVERDGASIGELLDELRETAPALAPAIETSSSPAAVWNLVVHLTDLDEALGLPRPPASLWQPIVDALRDRVPEQLAAVEDYELFRALFSRRSQRQLAELAGVDADEAPTAVGIFGTRDDDQPRP